MRHYTMTWQYDDANKVWNVYMNRELYASGPNLPATKALALKRWAAGWKHND